MNGQAGKGSRARRVDPKAYADGYDRSFGRCRTHPRYRVLRKPTADCAVCRRLWREKQLGL